MDLFKLKSESEPVGIYARVSQHIVDLVIHYHEQAKKAGQLDDPKLAKWVSKIPTLDDVAKVESGFIRYHAGIINLNPQEVDMEEDLFSERMQVSDDFELAVSPEGLFYFNMQRQLLPTSKRGELYKFQTPGIFGGLYFVPEDVVKGIVNYDFAPHMERAREFRAKIKRIGAGHKNLF